MKNRHFIALGAANMFIAIACGAFGAHALKKMLSVEMLGEWQTAVQYQVMHAVALIIIGILSLHASEAQIKALKHCGYAFLIGICIFSGSLYALAISDFKFLGAITPIGGLAFLIGWARLVVLYFRRKED